MGGVSRAQRSTQWCAAEPGPLHTELLAVPVLQRTVPLRYTLRRARDTRESWRARKRCGRAFDAPRRGAVDVGTAIELFRNLAQARRQELAGREAVEFLEAHDQRPPLVGIDVVALAVHHQRIVDVNAL